MSQETPMDRRSETKPVPYERRLDERVSILEVHVDNHATRLEENQELSHKLIDRLDKHMEANAVRDSKIQENLTMVTIAVTELSTTVAQTNDTLKVIAGIARESDKTIVRWDAISKTIIKLVTIIAMLIGAAWSVYTFSVQYPTAIAIQGKK